MMESPLLTSTGQMFITTRQLFFALNVSCSSQQCQPGHLHEATVRIHCQVSAFKGQLYLNATFVLYKLAVLQNSLFTPQACFCPQQLNCSSPYFNCSPQQTVDHLHRSVADLHSQLFAAEISCSPPQSAVRRRNQLFTSTGQRYSPPQLLFASTGQLFTP
jgi:hypothetical protein